jgi:hypothetical protein
VTPWTTARSAIDSWVLRHPLPAYLLLAFSLAWSSWVPLALLYHGSTDLESLIRSPLVVMLQTLGVTAPLLAALIVTRVTGGTTVVRRLLDGLKHWRVPVRWYAAACLLVPVLTVLGVGVRAALGVDPAVPQPSALATMLADIGWIGSVLSFPVQLFGQCFGSPLLERRSLSPITACGCPTKGPSRSPSPWRCVRCSWRSSDSPTYDHDAVPVSFDQDKGAPTRASRPGAGLAQQARVAGGHAVRHAPATEPSTTSPMEAVVATWSRRLPANSESRCGPVG